jgi:hypothetical protein
MSRGNLPSEPSLSPPENNTHPEYVNVTAEGVELTCQLEWEGDYDEGSWRSIYNIVNIEVADYDNEKLRELIWEELF